VDNKSLRAEARKLHCWFDVDRVPNDSATTTWKRTARLHQARWREARAHPIGSHPYDGTDGAKPVGSHIALEYATKTGANFLSPAVLAAVKTRIATPEPHQMLAEDRLWADLLSSMPLCFNLFGGLANDSTGAARAVGAWWPDAPQGSVTVRFEHSPGRRDPAFLGNKSAFDVAFEIDTGASRAIVGVETKYHEHAKAEPEPKPKALARYVEITERSGAFAKGWRKALVGTDLQQIWLDHLLVLSMLQHPSKKWSWGRFVVVYPAGNPSFHSAVTRYRNVLTDSLTYGFMRVDDIAWSPVMDETEMSAFRERYLFYSTA
jgi:hypothetical protein